MALCRAHTWPCRGLCGDIMPSLMPHLVTIQSNHPACQAASGHDTIYCIATQPFSISNLLLSRYKICIVTHYPVVQPSTYHDTTDCIVTHSSSGQPLLLFCHDTISCIATLFPNHQAFLVTIQSNCIVTFSQAK